MSATPRIFVGTLACGEAELDECCRVIADQQQVEIEHHIIRDQPELEAHRRLFTRWNDRRDRFDLFVKVDADTVLCRDTALAELFQLFVENDDVTGVQAGLHDYFSDAMIAGLNCFSPAVSFSVPDDELYCDRVVEQGHRRLLRPDDTKSLYPIAWHCRYPSPTQAFHFGYRRLLKGQGDFIGGLLKAWEEKGEDGRFWALCGARTAYFHPVADASYGSVEFIMIFKDVMAKIERGELTEAAVARDVRRILDRDTGIRLRRLATRMPLGKRMFG